MKSISVLVALLWGVTTAFAADPVGKYMAEGNGADGSGYSGTVTIEQTGQTYSVIWLIGGTRYVGTGIGDKNFIAVTYRSGNDTGLALYSADGGNWKGIWAWAGGRALRTEIWKRQ